MPFQHSFDRLSTAILILDTEHKVIYLNGAGEQLLGYSGRQLKGENLFNLLTTDFQPEILNQFAEDRQRGFIEGAQLKIGSRYITANIMLSSFIEEQKKYILLELQSSEYHSHIRKDIELQQQNRVSNHLIRNLAHEIKNPLGGIKGAAQLLQRKLPDNFSHKYSQIIIQESERLSTLVDRLLLPAEPEEKSLVNPHLLIEKALEIILLQSPSSIKVIKNYDPSLPELLIAAGQIQQSLLNLLKNAVEAIDKNGQIELKTRILHQHSIGKVQYKQVIRIDVIDNGSGIPESLLKDIFFPMISSKSDVNKNNRGLGLSIAQSFAQRHGGIIEVESVPGETCFSLYLPLTAT